MVETDARPTTQLAKRSVLSAPLLEPANRINVVGWWPSSFAGHLPHLSCLLFSCLVGHWVRGLEVNKQATDQKPLEQVVQHIYPYIQHDGRILSLPLAR